jgi:hypothetical protein
MLFSGDCHLQFVISDRLEHLMNPPICTSSLKPHQGFAKAFEDLQETLTTGLQLV